MTRSRLSAEDLGRLVRLEPDSGRLFWRVRPTEFFVAGPEQERAAKSWNTSFAGREAFRTLSGNGYYHGTLLGEKVCAHVVVFALYHGRWPDHTIDHVNGDRLDNRPENLRDVPHIQNMRNQPLSRASTTGVTGVHFDRARGKYAAHITIRGKTVHLGRFSAMGAAVRVRKRAEAKHGFHKNHGRNPQCSA